MKQSSFEKKVIEPYEMEYKERYILRFSSNKEMKEVFGESYMCREIAEQIWKDRMADATVTVHMLNGEEFFIY